MWFSVVLMEHNTLPIGKFWPLLFDRLLQTVKLLELDIRIDRSIICQIRNDSTEIRRHKDLDFFHILIY